MQKHETYTFKDILNGILKHKYKLFVLMVIALLFCGIYFQYVYKIFFEGSVIVYFDENSLIKQNTSYSFLKYSDDLNNGLAKYDIEYDVVNATGNIAIILKSENKEIIEKSRNFVKGFVEQVLPQHFKIDISIEKKVIENMIERSKQKINGISTEISQYEKIGKKIKYRESIISPETYLKIKNEMNHEIGSLEQNKNRNLFFQNIRNLQGYVNTIKSKIDSLKNNKKTIKIQLISLKQKLKDLNLFTVYDGQIKKTTRPIQMIFLICLGLVIFLYIVFIMNSIK